MLSTLSWDILLLGKTARCMFFIIKSNFFVSCNSFSINREKLGDYLKWTDYSTCLHKQFHTLLCSDIFIMQ